MPMDDQHMCVSLLTPSCSFLPCSCNAAVCGAPHIQLNALPLMPMICPPN
jgi:hypothetical protein